MVHLEIASDSLIERFQLGLDPEELGGIQDGAVEMDVDPQNEELSNLHVDLFAVQSHFTRQGNLSGNILGGVDGGSNEFFKK